MGRLEGQVLPQARRFEDLKVDHEGKELPVIEPVETAVRSLSKLSGEDTTKLRAIGDGS